jgi:DNA-binding NtrC family response regulator
MTAKYISNFKDSRFETLPYKTSPHRRILKLENERDLRQLSAKVLKEAECQVDIAEDGTAAWTAPRDRRYGLLITDQSLPNASGIEFVNKIHTARMTLPAIMAKGVLPIQEFDLNPFLRSVNLLFKPHSFEQWLSMIEIIAPTTCRGSDDEPLPPLPPEPPLPPLPRMTAR